MPRRRRAPTRGRGGGGLTVRGFGDGVSASGAFKRLLQLFDQVRRLFTIHPLRDGQISQGFDAVQGTQQQVHCRLVQRGGAIAHQAQQILGAVGYRLQGTQLHDPAEALERVERTKQGGDFIGAQFSRIGLDQQRLDPFNVLFGFNRKLSPNRLNKVI